MDDSPLLFYYNLARVQEREQSKLREPHLNRKGLFALGRRRSMMSEQFKEELAKELGFWDVVQKEGWGGIKASDAGNMVKRAIQIAEEQLANRS